MRASGSMPRSAAHSSEQTTTQDAPSLTPGAFPAVVVPSGSKTGFNDASRSSVVSRRTPSSAATPPTGTISSSKRPASCAAAARSWERSAHASCSSRLIPSSRATADACWTMCRPSKVEVSPSKTVWSSTSPLPRR